jgi:hypothetical protein
MHGGHKDRPGREETFLILLVRLDVRVDESQDKHQRSRRLTDALKRKYGWYGAQGAVDIERRVQRGKIRRKAGEKPEERRCQKTKKESSGDKELASIPSALIQYTGTKSNEFQC